MGTIRRISPRRTKFKVKKFWIDAVFNEVKKLNWNHLSKARRNFPLGHESAVSRRWRKNTAGR